jgi:hypothetical protein
MQNGTALLLFSLPLVCMVVPGFIALVKFSMPSSICYEADAPGAYFPTISLLGKPCITTFASGEKMVFGNVSIPSSESGCV